MREVERLTRLSRFHAPAGGAAFGFAVLAFVAMNGVQPRAHADPSTPHVASARAAFLPRGVLLRPADGDTRLLLEPGGPFAAMIFRDGARGDHMAVVYYGAMRSERDGAWLPDVRFWQETPWSADVNALVWGLEGDALYVSTGENGSGGVYRLDLRTRKASRVWPNDETSTAEQGPGRSCEILYADPLRHVLHVRYQAAAVRAPIAVEVRLE